jgi:hypothetical protein
MSALPNQLIDFPEPAGGLCLSLDCVDNEPVPACKHGFKQALQMSIGGEATVNLQDSGPGAPGSAFCGPLAKSPTLAFPPITSLFKSRAVGSQPVARHQVARRGGRFRICWN